MDVFEVDFSGVGHELTLLREARRRLVFGQEDFVAILVIPAGFKHGISENDVCGAVIVHAD